MLFLLSSLLIGGLTQSVDNDSLMSRSYREGFCFEFIRSVSVAARCSSGEGCAPIIVNKLGSAFLLRGVTNFTTHYGSQLVVHDLQIGNRPETSLVNVDRPLAADVFGLHFKPGTLTYTDFEIALDLATHDYILYVEPLTFERARRIESEWSQERLIQEIDSLLQQKEKSWFGVQPEGDQSKALTRSQLMTIRDRLSLNIPRASLLHILQFDDRFLYPHSYIPNGRKLLNTIVDDQDIRGNLGSARPRRPAESLP